MDRLGRRVGLWFGALLGLILVLFALLAVTAAWLLATDRGTQVLKGELVKRLPGLEINGLSGNLRQGLQIEWLQYTAEFVVELRGAEVEIELWPLIDLQALHVTRFSVDILHIQPAAEQSSSGQTMNPAELVLPELPLAVYLHSADMGQLSYDSTSVSDLHVAGAWTASGLQISDLRLVHNGLQVDGRVSLIPSRSGPLDIDLAATWFLEDTRGRLTASGMLTRPRVVHRLHLPERTAVVSEGELQLHAWPTVSAQLRHTNTEPDIKLTTNIVGANSAWRIDVAGRAMGYNLQGQVDAQLEQTVRLQISRARVADVLQVRGAVDIAPDLQVNLEVSSADVAPLQLGVSGDILSQVQWRDNRLQLSMRSSRLVSQQFEANQFVLDAQGALAQLTFNMGWREGRLSGEVMDLLGEQTSIKIDDGAQLNYADYKLSSSGVFTIRRRGSLWSVTPHCWLGLGEICIESSELSETAVSMRGRLADLQLAVLNDWVPATFAKDARLSGSWAWQMADGSWQVDAALNSHHLNFTAAGRSFDWLPDIELSTRVTPAAVHVKASASQPGLNWQALLDSDGWGQDAAVIGSIQIEADASTLPSVDPALQRLAGLIKADAVLSGTIAAPQLTAQGIWQQGALAWADPALELSGIDMNWQADPSGWQVQGSAQSEQGGALQISGRGDGYDINANAEADVSSAGLRLQSDMWDVTAIPSAHITARQGKVSFTGRAQIPTAAVTVKTLPNALPKPVADVRVRGRSMPIVDESQNVVEGTLQVALGDNVRLDLLALAVRLTGNVEAKITGTEVVALHGELNVADGSLNASGQTLKVKQGRILFSGDPTLPYVDLIATRDIKDRTPALEVGLRISGRADALKTNVYSLPAMSETRALSFLVLGRDFNEASDADSNQLLSAAISLGLSQSQGVVEQLRGALGLDELSALAAEQNDVAIVAGKRVTEDLYVRYSYNALSAVSALIIRYHLNERWRLEATNDVNSSMDLLYEFSR